MTDLQRFRDDRANGEIAATELRTTLAVRARCRRLLAHTRSAGSPWFALDDDALAAAARGLASAQPLHAHRAQVPLPSVWRLLESGGIDRRRALEALLRTLPEANRTHARIDLATVAVLLSAGAEAMVRYAEPATGRVLSGPAGWAVATLHAFKAGLFSSDPMRPFQADALGLRGVITDRLAQAFQAQDGRAHHEISRRAILLRRLGELLSEQPEVFGDEGRPAGVFDIIVSPYGHGIPHTADADAHDILSQLLTSLADLWPGGSAIGGVALGDCWQHRALQGEGPAEGWIPLHATLQWLACSLLEPFFWGGVQVRGIAGLTVPAHRPLGRWMLEQGLLRLRDTQAAAHRWHPADQIIVEWRALSLALFDDLCERVRATRSLGAQGLAAAPLLSIALSESRPHVPIPSSPAAQDLRVDADPALF